VVEMAATGEEAVVSKEARVVGEVAIRREATERVQTVSDTVRRTEVVVEGAGGPEPAEAGPLVGRGTSPAR
jgi:stress response protein YsnF